MTRDPHAPGPPISHRATKLMNLGGGRDLAVLPKADLHLHLEAAMRPETAVELAVRHSQRPPRLDGWRGFEDFQRAYRSLVALIRTEDDLRRLIGETVQDAAADGVVWIEPHFHPPTYSHIAPPEHILETVLDEAGRVGHTHDVGVGLILAASRNRHPRHAITLARLATRYVGHGVVGLGLAGAEHARPTDDFAAPFARARDAGLLIVPHAGEFGTPAELRHVLDCLGPDRVAHGLTAAADPALMHHLADHCITLDIALTSNQRLGAVPNLGAHPLPRLIAAAVPCTLGSDDPLLLSTSLLREYQLARARLSLTDQQLATLARTSLRASGAPPRLITRTLTRINRWLATTPEPPGVG